jgi:hypothetical protein
MCEVSLRQRRSTHDLLEYLGIEDAETVVKRGRLNWFVHVERKMRED